MTPPRNWNKLEKMNQQAKTAYMASGNVTTGIIWLMEDESSKWPKRFYVAKIRGITVSDRGRYKFDTVEEARAFGYELRDYWRAELNSLEPTP